MLLSLGAHWEKSFRPRTSKKLVKKTVSKAGKVQVTGIPSHLRESAEYPDDFGWAVAALARPGDLPEPSTDAGFYACMFFPCASFGMIWASFFVYL